jgi:hypothetical protein
MWGRYPHIDTYPHRVYDGRGGTLEFSGSATAWTLNGLGVLAVHYITNK